MDSNVTRKVQLIQLDLMKKLHALCVEKNIRYMLLSGSLLGAVRHKGFIPWDDDLDIALLRPDYERLIKILKEEPIEGCFLQTLETDNHYVQPYAKLRKNNTKFVETYFANAAMHNGIFIDIFAFDKVPSPANKAAHLRMLMTKPLIFALWQKENCRMPRKGIKKLEYVSSFCLGVFSKKRHAKWIDDLIIRENKDWEYVANMYGFMRNYLRREDFLDLVLMKFEDTEFYVPRKWDEMLTHLFGNYMKWPPEGKRHSEHIISKIEFE